MPKMQGPVFAELPLRTTSIKRLSCHRGVSLPLTSSYFLKHMPSNLGRTSRLAPSHSSIHTPSFIPFLKEVKNIGGPLFGSGLGPRQRH